MRWMYRNAVFVMDAHKTKSDVCDLLHEANVAKGRKFHYERAWFIIMTGMI